jgi:hypothetical protein
LFLYDIYNKNIIMKKLIKHIKDLFKKQKVSLDPNSVEGKVLTALNTIIQSPAIQGMEFKVSSKCDKTSVINDIEFCDEVYVHDSYEEQTLNNTCIDACKVTRDAAKDICDATRATCNTGCDAVKVGYDACIGTCDVTRQACKGGCSAVDWTCNGCCSKGCDSASSSCKSGCNSAFPYQSCTDGCNKMSSDCKSGADSMYNVCVDGCGYLTITGGYSFRLLNIKGVGTIQVTNVYDMVPKENELNVFSVSMDLNVPQVIANSYYKLWQDPIPAVEGNLPVVATDVKGSAKGTLTIVCDGSGKSGYYLQLDSLTIEIPTNIYDSNALTQLVYALGMEVEYVTGGIVDMNQMLLDMANGMLADEVMKVINDILDDMKIDDANC